MVERRRRPQYVGCGEILYLRIPFPFFHVENTGQNARKDEKKGKIDHSASDLEGIDRAFERSKTARKKFHRYFTRRERAKTFLRQSAKIKKETRAREKEVRPRFISDRKWRILK